MAEIIHDTTRGWLLLTEWWPDPEEYRPFTTDYEDDKADCLSTAIEIDEDDWVEIRKKSKFAFKDHHPYSVDAEFEVVEQVKNPMSGEWETTELRGALSTVRQIARLVKAKEGPITVPTGRLINKGLGGHKVEPEPTESQDELWKDLIDVYDVEDRKGYGYATLIKALSARFRIERI